MELLKLHIELTQLQDYLSTNQLLEHTLDKLGVKKNRDIFDKIDDLYDEEVDYIESTRDMVDKVKRYPYIKLSEKIAFIQKTKEETRKKVSTWIKKEEKLSEFLSDHITVLTSVMEEIEQNYPKAFSKNSFFNPEPKGLEKIRNHLKRLYDTLKDNDRLYLLGYSDTSYLINNEFNIPPLENRSSKFYNSLTTRVLHSDYQEKCYTGIIYLEAMQIYKDYLKNPWLDKEKNKAVRKIINASFEEESDKVLQKELQTMQFNKPLTLTELIKKAKGE